MSRQTYFKWSNNQTNVLKELKNFLSTEAMVDVTIACDGQSLKAHKIVLSAYSPYFRTLFSENPCKHPIVLLKGMKYTVLKLVIDFMYSGEIEMADDQLSDIIEVAQSLGVKELEGVEFQNSQSDGESENILGSANSTCHDPNKHSGRKYDFNSSNRINIINEFKNFLSSEAMVDVTLCCGGQILKAHKIILAAYSPLFKSLFLDNTCTHPIVILHDIKYTELKSIINFMYSNEVNITSGEVSFLVKTAQTLRMVLLEEVDLQNSQLNDKPENQIGDVPENQSVGELLHEPVCSINVSNWILEQERSLNDQNDDGGCITEIKQEIDDMDLSILPTNNPVVISLSRDDANPYIKCEQDQSVEQNFDSNIAVKESCGSFTQNNIQKQVFMENNLPRQSLQSSVNSDLELNSECAGTSSLVPAISTNTLIVDSQGSRTSSGEEFADDCRQLLDEDTLESLISKSYPQLKHKNKLHNILSNSNQSASVGINVNDSVSIGGTSEVTYRRSPSPQPSASTSRTLKKELDLEQIVRVKLPELFNTLKAGDASSINILKKRKLNRLIVDTYIEKYGCHATTQEKINLAKSIVTTFPVLKGSSGEGFEQWFCPGANGASPSGFIAQRFRNFRYRKLSSVERAELNVRRRSKIIPKQTPQVLGKKDTSVEFFQKQQWLIENDQPLEKVLTFMQDTFEGRRYDILNSVSEDIIQSWPRILNPHVIDAEFIRIYGEETSDSLCSDFGFMSSQIILQAKNCGMKLAEDIVKNLMFDLSDPDNVTERICCAIQLLPFLLPQGVIIKQSDEKKMKIRPSSSLSLDHFIQFVPFWKSIDQFMREDRHHVLDRKHPFILAIGDKYNPRQTFVVFENNCITTNSLLKAVDLCFKLSYILNIEFSPYCRNVWHFINELFYKCEFSAELPSCILELKNRLFHSFPAI